jgi:hypothetical protein
MTAVLGIFNKECVVLAGDSAATYKSQDGLIIKHSANKIFPLTDRPPAAAMVYGASTFLGIPIELILQDFYSQKGQVAFETLEDCKNALLVHMQHYVAHGEPELHLIHRFVQEIMETCLCEHAASSDESDEERFRQAVEKRSKEWACLDRIVSTAIEDEALPDLELEEIVGLAMRHYLATKHTAQLQVDETQIHLVSKHVLLMLSRLPTLSGTGIIVAGYGTTSLFAGYIEMLIEGAYHGKMRFVVKSENSVTHFRPAFVAVFAQSSAAEGFLLGIDAKLHRFFLSRVREMFLDFIHLIVESIEQPQQESLRKALKGVFEESILHLKADLRNFQDREYTHASSQALTLLSQDDLAEIAEALISLTAIKKRISGQPEDVGGPVDITVLTKYGGFTWLKRKPKTPFKTKPKTHAG